MRLVAHDHTIEAFASDRTGLNGRGNVTSDITVLPGDKKQ
jgi:hypothetical protein